MRVIAQRLDCDCGVACVAMLADVSYKKAREAVHGENPISYTSYSMLRRALIGLGRFSPQRLAAIEERNFRDFEQNGLLKLKPWKSGYHHWAVWDAKNQIPIDPNVTDRYRRFPVVAFALVS